MTERRTVYEIYWEILIFCREPRSLTSIINRCDLNTKIGQQHVHFLEGKGYLHRQDTDGKTTYAATPKAQEYITLFNQLYRSLFEGTPTFKLP